MRFNHKIVMKVDQSFLVLVNLLPVGGSSEVIILGCLRTKIPCLTNLLMYWSILLLTEMP